MRAKTLSLLYVTIWLASTAFALVARSSAHQARAGTRPEYPKGYDPQSCPLSSTKIILRTTPAGSEAFRLPAARVLPPTGEPSTTQRGLTPVDLFQVCRQVSSFKFQSGLDLVEQLTTSALQPGLYVISAKANKAIRTLHIYSPLGKLSPPFISIQNNQVDHVGAQFQVSAPVEVQILMRFWLTNAEVEIALFNVGPVNYLGPASRRAGVS